MKYLNALNQLSELGAAKLKMLGDYFPDFESAWTAGISDLKQSGVGEKAAEAVAAARGKIDPDTEMERLNKAGVSIISINSESYPPLLKETYSAPAVLYFKGVLPKENELPIAVVGTRKATSYGREATEKIISELSCFNAGFNIISGLAFGIDFTAHNAALKSELRTAAVLGSGLGEIFPKSNEKLAEQIIAEGGCLISEFPLSYPPLRENFPQRNRIVSGLSLGTLVVEAPKKSGALITARLALEQNREVFVVPGSIFSFNSQGSNLLIKEGAAPVFSGQDILESLGISFTEEEIKSDFQPENEEEKTIMETLSSQQISVDELNIALSLDVKIISATLSILELKGAVKNIEGKWTAG